MILKPITRGIATLIHGGFKKIGSKKTNPLFLIICSQSGEARRSSSVKYNRAYNIKDPRYWMKAKP
jgi:hypothetical protein